ncbi:hypothetical protein HKD37_10G027355 [Glycine soja]
MVRLLLPRDSLTSSTPSLSIVSMRVRSSDVAPAPFPPPTEVRPSPSHLDACGPFPILISTPFSSPIDTHGPSLVPTSTPSSSPVVANMPTNEDVPNLAMEDPPPLNDCFTHLRLRQRLSLCPLGNNFVTLGLHGEQFQKIIKNFFPNIFRENWSGDLRKKMKLRKFLTRNPFINFLRCLGMSEMKIKRAYWIEDRVWNDLLLHWNALEYCSKCAHAKKRASEKGGCKYTSGSISLQDHTIRLLEEFGRSVYIDEVFQQTHLRNDTSQFVNDRSRQKHARLSQARFDAASSVGKSQLIPLDPPKEQRLRSQCWVAVVGPKHKGCLYDIGDIAHTYKCGNDNFMQHTQGSSNRAQDAVKI